MAWQACNHTHHQLSHSSQTCNALASFSNRKLSESEYRHRIPEQHCNHIIVAVLGSKHGLSCHHLICQQSQGPHVSSCGGNCCGFLAVHCCCCRRYILQCTKLLLRRYMYTHVCCIWCRMCDKQLGVSVQIAKATSEEF